MSAQAITGKSFLEGFTEVYNSFSFVSENRSLIKYYLAPFILNLIVLSSIFYFSYTALNPWLHSFVQGDAWFMKIISLVVSPVLFIFLLIITIFIYSIAGTIIASPFLDFLSARTEEVFSGVTPCSGMSFYESIKDILRITGNVIKLLFLLVILNTALLFLNLLPGGALIYAALNFLFTAFFYGFQFFDFPLERKFISFREKLIVCWKFRYLVCGNGSAFFLLSFIPIAGFLSLNSATVGAAISFKKHIEPCLKGVHANE